MTMLFAAVHESACGTFRTSRDVRLESAFWVKAEVGFRGRASALPQTGYRDRRRLVENQFPVSVGALACATLSAWGGHEAA